MHMLYYPEILYICPEKFLEPIPPHTALKMPHVGIPSFENECPYRISQLLQVPTLLEVIGYGLWIGYTKLDRKNKGL